MKPYTVSVDIAAPRSQIVALFKDPANLKHWQNGFQSIEHIEGTPGEVGAKSIIRYKSGKREIVLTEVITKNDLPDAFAGHYSWGEGANTLDNRFIELSPEMTRWESTCDYELGGCMLRLMGLLFSGKFRQQNQMYLDNFKAFVEDGTSIAS